MGTSVKGDVQAGRHGEYRLAHRPGIEGEPHIGTEVENVALGIAGDPPADHGKEQQVRVCEEYRLLLLTVPGLVAAMVTNRAVNWEWAARTAFLAVLLTATNPGAPMMIRIECLWPAESGPDSLVPVFVRMAMPPLPIVLLLLPARLVEFVVLPVMFIEVASVRPLFRLVPFVHIVMSPIFVASRLTVIASILGVNGHW